MYSQNREEYFLNLQKLYKNVAPTIEIRKILNTLHEHADKMCFAMINTDRFIGMSYRYSANRYMSIMVRYLYTHNCQSAKINLPKPKELYPSIKQIAR